MATATLELTDRQKREQEYYDEYASTYDLSQRIDFSPVTSKRRRPWNSYWSIYHLAKDHHRVGATLLDFGSGPGHNALRFAKLGYKVEGFDISGSNIAIAQKLFEVKGFGGKGHFQVSAAEKLPYPDQHFDFIAGIDILHHVDIKESLKECHRVLKEGGVAVFREPLEVPLLDDLRNTSFMKLIAPKEKSFELHITEDERKLNKRDVDIIRSIFPLCEMRRFTILARLDRFFREGSDPRPSLLEKLDYHLIRYFPILQNLGGGVIFILKKP